jgi:general secretion pathway protein G
MQFKHNKYRRKAFTLIELLIVIAIIGILFIVLVSKVDFASDKAKTTGVQTDFRSFKIAFETVAIENDGFNTLGLDTGDKNGNRVRDSVDVGDLNEN